MNDKFNIVSGEFEGNFYTHQKSVLSASEWNAHEKRHDIHLYRGELKNFREEIDYSPEKLRNRESLLLHNVTNVQFHFGAESDGTNANRIFNFEQLLLRDAVVKESWELNGKTYGIISGKVIGKVKNEVKASDASNPQEPPTPPPVLPISDSPDNSRTDSGGESNMRNYHSGCLPFFSGCLGNIWRLLLALLLLFFMLWFLKGCWNKNEARQNCCNDRDRMVIENKKLQNEMDSLKMRMVDLDRLLSDCQNEQKKNGELEERRRKTGGRVGEVTVTLMWDSEDDLDLLVTEPQGQLIWHEQKTSGSGGFLDVDNNKHGAPPYSSTPVENIRWLNNAPEGVYQVMVTCFAKHTDLEEIPFYLEVKTNEHIESYEGILKMPKNNEEFNFEYIKNSTQTK